MAKTVYTGARTIDPTIRNGWRPSIGDFVCVDASGNRIDPASTEANVPAPIGDGASHPLSGYYATLGAAQADYPHATNLSNELAWATFQKAINSIKTAGGGTLVIPPGIYIFGLGISLVDCSNIEIYGACDRTILKPSASYPESENFIDLSGSIGINLHDFVIDGSNVAFATISLSSIYGDGTVANPVYGHTTIERVNHVNWEQQGIGVGATTGYEAYDINILNNRFDGCGAGTEGSHPIDCGSSGTKRKYRIIGNRLYFTSQPTSPATAGNGIFTGHGLNYDFTICENQIYDCPASAIVVYNRPFGTESCKFENVVVNGNVIFRPRLNGIRVLGAKGVTVNANAIQNPGYGTPAAAVQVANGFEGDVYGGPAGTYLKAEDIVITGNSLTDNQVVHTMTCGVQIATDDPTGAPSGVLSSNTISGYTTTDVLFDSLTTHMDWGVVRHLPGMIGHGNPNAFLNGHAAMSVLGDVLAEATSGSDEPTNLFVKLLVSPEVAAGDYMMGVGLNTRFDRATSKFKSGYDGVNNGCAALLTTQADGSIRVVCKASTSGAVQEMTAAQLATAIQAIFQPDQVRLMPANTEILRAKAAGVAIGAFDPTAKVHLPAGTATAGTAPLKLTSGTNLSAVEDGAFEYDGTDLYFSVGSTRYKLGRLTLSGDLTHLGNIAALQPAGGNEVGAWLISRSFEADGGWTLGFGINCRWDGSNWVVPANAGSAGASVITCSPSDGTISFYNLPNNGNTGYSLTTAQLAAYRRCYLDTNGVLTFPGAAGAGAYASGGVTLTSSGGASLGVTASSITAATALGITGDPHVDINVAHVGNLSSSAMVATDSNALLTSMSVSDLATALRTYLDFVYAGVSHDHDADYAAIGHNHDAAYSAIGHTH